MATIEAKRRRLANSQRQKMDKPLGNSRSNYTNDKIPLRFKTNAQQRIWLHVLRKHIQRLHSHTHTHTHSDGQFKRKHLPLGILILFFSFSATPDSFARLNASAVNCVNLYVLFNAFVYFTWPVFNCPCALNWSIDHWLLNPFDWIDSVLDNIANIFWRKIAEIPLTHSPNGI